MSDPYHSHAELEGWLEKLGKSLKRLEETFTQISLNVREIEDAHARINFRLRELSGRVTDLESLIGAGGASQELRQQIEKGYRVLKEPSPPPKKE
jgi:hypothetical protein